MGVPQLLVRDIEAAIVRKLRRRAAAQGISMEEAHRRLLRNALTDKHDGPQDDFLAYLRSIPGGEEDEFARVSSQPRKNEL
jgi:plasmid stability protein